MPKTRATPYVKKGVIHSVHENQAGPVPAHATPGDEAVISYGDVEASNDAQLRAPAESLAGRKVTVLPEAYESLGGPNKGRVIQQVRDNATGAVHGVPVERLKRGSGASVKVFRGWRQRFDDALTEQAHKLEQQKKWVEVRPGVRRLAFG